MIVTRKFKSLKNKELDNFPKHYLYPGDLFVNRKPHRVTTLLGTCVAVCLWDKELNVGGINHYLLPNSAEKTDEPLKYGNTSIKLLIHKLITMGAKKENLRAKVIGGAQNADNYFDTGRQNVFVAIQILTDEGIPIVGKNVGGKLGRKIVFFTHTGEVFMKMLNSSAKEIEAIQK